MKTTRRFITIALAASLAIVSSAQQVTTLYFLENTPMRHMINPAFQPVSQGYFSILPLGYTSATVGNNSLTISDVLFVDPLTGNTITPLHPNADKQTFLRTMQTMTLVNGGATLGLFNIGFRSKEDGYLTIGINQRLDFGSSIPKSMFQFVLGGPGNVIAGNTTLALSGLGTNVTSYTEIGFGYSYRINDHWTVGGKAKFLLGQAYMGLNARTMNIVTGEEKWTINGNLGLNIAGPFDFSQLPNFDGMNLNTLISDLKGEEGASTPVNWNKVIDFSNYGRMVTPNGYGAAFDIGFTYKPIENLQLSFALNDLGFLYWKGRQYDCSVDTAFTGLGNIDFGDPAFRDETGNFSTQLMLDSVVRGLRGLTAGVLLRQTGAKGYARMITTRLNVGLDVNFWDNRIGLGVVSATRLYNARLYEEVTFGFSFRPVNWFNIAASYSLLENGKYSNVGAGLSLMPYDGINLTLAMDYIPTSYAPIDKTAAKPLYVMPYKTKNVNIAFGLCFCWGTNKHDRDKDGVWDKLDMCPNTPRGIEVDEFGCPLDTDKDGVPDYLDKCPDTPAEAIGHTDSVGCPLDSDGDGVPDYLDKCPNTPAEAIGYTDSVGCPLDTDGDGVPDYLDKCPNTPAEAIGFVNEDGCPKDSDGDGVPDYLDRCPNTPAEASVDANGCPQDSDKDGVPDYLDECPNTPAKAIGFVNERGCPKDSDGDGVPDYLDECPYIVGVKANKGCPEVKREVRQLLQKAMQGIEFETGKATIKSKSYPILNSIAKIFIENSNYYVEVQGHTDNTGKLASNRRISQQRAEAVRKYLIKKGVPAERLTAKGYGPDKPIASNKNAQGRAKNRRVEFKISFEEIHYETVMDHADKTQAE